ncbi:alkanesulfonate transporter substrate-binding subunit [Striga asiatica]|uniref:Alkanesulfonate transporter substrate-binding subunit n=1 Tax=Striga asiatica TaxID=4170 RepID=A0A5A7P9X6_STRAF|nr:alkanesulfonate transporter substrate-binding subunit [Striga asiatica]
MINSPLTYINLRPNAPPNRLLLIGRHKHIGKVALAILAGILCRHIVSCRKVRITAVEKLAAIIVHHGTSITARTQTVLSLHSQLKARQKWAHREWVGFLTQFLTGLFLGLEFLTLSLSFSLRMES